MDTGRDREAAVRTFLIADIRGYTRFTAQHGDEAASRLAMRFAAIAGEGVSAWDGELVELRGDEALAVFSSARQALRAAVELQAAFAAATAEDPSLPMTVGIGLDAGEAVPVTDGYRGAALNMAARLCSVASAGTVLATLGLARLAGPVPGLAVGDPEPTAFKGVEAPVDVVRITPVTSLPATHVTGTGSRPPVALPPELEPLVPLIGRDAELRRLRWHWRRASAGDGRVVIVSGAPGIGKTRLAAELAGEVAAAGLSVAYLPAGRPIPAAVEAPAGDEPSLVVADDVDAAGPAIVELAMRLAEAAPGSRRLVLLIHRREAPGPLVARLELLAPREQRITLGPLDTDAVRAIVALYAGAAASDAPVGELAADSGGVPASIHRMAGSWARTAATHRLGSSAQRAATERRGLRAAEAALFADMTDLELARERERLYVGDPTIDPVFDGPVVCPYKGLAEFDAADSDFFFGRDRLIAELVARFVGGSFLGLVGDSGSGKSSALRAGLLPSLAAGVLPGSATWPQLIIRPGEHPLAELDRAIARLTGAHRDAAGPAAALTAALDGLDPGQRLVVVVDQFEEVFNATRDPAERSAFLDLLTTERPGLKVIVSMRADHYGRCAAYPALARLMGTDQVLVGPLTGVEIAAVIEHPAQRAGLRVEPALTAALVADAGAEPGVLPLLSTALLELWQARDGSRLTLSAYRASGGLHGAIARLAESTWSGLDAHRRSVARSILLRLAGSGEGSGLVRRRVSLAELDAERDPAIGEVLGTLTAARLLTTGDGHVEVAHEALLREWPRLQEWLAEDAAGREIRLHLIDAARDWEANGRDPGDLYRGARLATALEWAPDHQLELNERERAFLDAGRQVSAQDVERQRRTNRRLRGLLVGTAGLLVVALVAGGFAFAQGQRAEEEAARAAAQADVAASEAARATQEQERAERSARSARSRALLASAVVAIDLDPQLARLLALEAASTEDEPTFDSITTMHDVLAADRLLTVVRWPEERGVTEAWMDLAPAGDAIAALAYADNRPDVLEVLSVADGGVIWSFAAPAAEEQVTRLWDPLYTDDGSMVISAALWDDPDTAYAGSGLGVLLLDATSGSLLRTIDVGPCGARLMGLGGQLALIRTPRGELGSVCDWEDPDGLDLGVVDLATGDVTTLARGTPDWGAAIAADGRLVAYDALEEGVPEARLVETATGRDVYTFRSDAIGFEQGNAGVQALSPDGRYLVYGDRPAVVLDTTSPPGAARYRKVEAMGGEGSGYTFDPTGGNIFGASRDGRLRRWAVPSGLRIGEWGPVPNSRPMLSADGRLALIGADDAGPMASIYRLDVDPRGDLRAVPTCRGFTAGGSLRIAAGSAALLQVCDGQDPLTGMLQVIDPSTLDVRHTLPDMGGQRLALSPDGRHVVAQRKTSRTAYGPLVVIDALTGKDVRELAGLCAWDASSEQRSVGACRTFPEPPFPIWAQSVSWSPDGRWIGVLDDWFEDGQIVRDVAVWDASSGALVFTAPRPDPRLDPEADPAFWVDLTFTPDSESLLISEAGGRMIRYATSTWERADPVTLTGVAAGMDARLLGFDRQGRLIVAEGRNLQRASPLIWLDAETFAVLGAVEAAHAGSLKGYALSPDGRSLATGGSDGVIRVWDTATRALLQEAHIPAQVQGLAFLDDDHLVAAPDGGGLVEFTTDPAELLATVGSGLTRGFTQTECATYAIDACPTLDESRSAGQRSP